MSNLDQKQMLKHQINEENEAKISSIESSYHKEIEKLKTEISILNNQLATMKDKINNSSSLRSSLFFSQSYKCLHRGIIEFNFINKASIKNIQPSVIKVINLISSLISENFTDYELKMYGSYATNLCLPWSDIDLLLSKVNGIPDFESFKRLFLLIEQSNLFTNSKFIDATSVPVIKFLYFDKEKFIDIRVDITLFDQKHQGLKCIKLIESYKEEYEALEYLVIIVKQILKNNDLNDPFKGGISSYGIVLMIVAYLQHEQEKKYVDLSIKGDNLGKLLYGFLSYYSNFDEKRYYIMATSKYNKYDIRHIPKFIQGCENIVIIDPLNCNNNVGKSSFNYLKIKMLFSNLAQMIRGNNSSTCCCVKNQSVNFNSEYFNNKDKEEAEHGMVKSNSMSTALNQEKEKEADSCLFVKIMNS